MDPNLPDVAAALPPPFVPQAPTGGSPSTAESSPRRARFMFDESPVKMAREPDTTAHNDDNDLPASINSTSLSGIALLPQNLMTCSTNSGTTPLLACSGASVHRSPGGLSATSGSLRVPPMCTAAVATTPTFGGTPGAGSVALNSPPSVGQQQRRLSFSFAAPAAFAASDDTDDGGNHMHHTLAVPMQVDDDDAASSGGAELVNDSITTAALGLSFACEKEFDDTTGEAAMINDIVLFDEVGRGACGRVVRGVSDRYDFELAVKEVPRRLLLGTQAPTEIAFADGSFATVPLTAEVRVLAQLSHPNIVPMLEMIDDKELSSVYMVMPYIKGRGQAGETSLVTTQDDEEALGDGTFKCTQLPQAELRVVATSMADALLYCARCSVVHGDVKPENILMADGGSTDGVPRALLADFGVSMLVQSDAAATPRHVPLPPKEDNMAPAGEVHSLIDLLDVDEPTGACGLPPSSKLGGGMSALTSNESAAGIAMRPRGTPAFLAPELVSGASPHPTPATDAWALGVTLFGLRYGRLPFAGRTMADLHRAILQDEPPFPPALPRDREERRWRALLRPLLAKQPEERCAALHGLLELTSNN